MKTTVKPNRQVEFLKPYRVDQTFYPIRLDANETSNMLYQDGILLTDIAFHRYPDHEATTLREKLSTWLKVDANDIVIGNGSSELIELIFKTFLTQGDRVIAFEPTFSMYHVYADLYGMTYRGVNFEETSESSMSAMIQAIQEDKPAVIFLCTPNNPTGFQFKKEDIIRLLTSTQALVVIDEAYIEFADQRESMTNDITKYQHACLLRTFSKAFGLASIRLGYMIAHQEVTQWIHRVRSPYHVNQISQAIGCLALERTFEMINHVQHVVDERERVYQTLVNLGLPVEPSKGNFIYIKPQALRLSDGLKKRGIIIREWPDGSSRITIGLPEENNSLIQAIKEIIS